jgi:nucleoside-diphosphate-sugar epimerase
MIKKILITGGAGFFGLHMTRYLHGRGHRVVLLDIAPYETAEYPPDGVEYLEGDVRVPADMERALDGVSHVIHAAAALPLWSRDDIFSTNVEGTRVVLERAAAAGVSRTAFVSSTAVYGVPKVHPLYEYYPRVGVGDYGESKILAETVCEEFRRRGQPVGVIRPKTFIGPYRLGVFQILFDWIEGGHRIPLVGSGKNRYQLLDVEDLCDAFYRMITTEDDDAACDVYNAGAVEYGRVIDDVGALCAHAGTGARAMPTPAAPVIAALTVFEALRLSPLYKWIYGTAHTDSFVSTDKLRARLDWAPRYSNAAALIRSYDWYLANRDTVPAGSGVTHRVAWDQGILKVFKKIL